MIDAVSPDVQEDINIAMLACMHRETGERPQHRAPHRVDKRRKSDP